MLKGRLQVAQQRNVPWKVLSGIDRYVGAMNERKRPVEVDRGSSLPNGHLEVFFIEEMKDSRVNCYR